MRNFLKVHLISLNGKVFLWVFTVTVIITILLPASMQLLLSGEYKCG